MTRTEHRIHPEVVHHGAGTWSGRIRGGNGKIVWVTEVYRRRREAVHAINFLAVVFARGSYDPEIRFVKGPRLLAGQTPADVKIGPA